MSATIASQHAQYDIGIKRISDHTLPPIRLSIVTPVMTFSDCLTPEQAIEIAQELVRQAKPPITCIVKRASGETEEVPLNEELNESIRFSAGMLKGIAGGTLIEPDRKSKPPIKFVPRSQA